MKHSGCMLLLCPLLVSIIISVTPSAVAATANFDATILHGDCDLSTYNGSYVNLGSVSPDFVRNSGVGEVMSRAENVKVKCQGAQTGVNDPLPVLSIRTGAGTTSFGNGTYFIDQNKSVENTAMGFRLRVRAPNQVVIPGNGPNWSQFLGAEDIPLGSMATDLTDEDIGIEFSMWCNPSGTQSVEDCARTGTNHASFDISLFYP